MENSNSKSQTLEEIAQFLKNSDKKVQLIYAFNGSGKTRLSNKINELVKENGKNTIFYYNAFTEDLFHWDNESPVPIFSMYKNKFTRKVIKLFEEDGSDQLNNTFQNYTNNKNLSANIRDESNIIFTTVNKESGKLEKNIKISKGEESNFIWSFFYSFLSIIFTKMEEQKEDSSFNGLKYIIIDDPVSSLDENHLIELAVNLAQLIKNSHQKIKFIITTHNPLFYNVLYNEFSSKNCYMLSKFEDGSFVLQKKKGDSNKSFSYHLYLVEQIESAISNQCIEKYHFILLRNLYEKTANFLGYPKWSELLPDDKQTYYNRIIQFTSHSTLSNEIIAEPTEPEKQIVRFLLGHLIGNYNFWQQKEKT